MFKLTQEEELKKILEDDGVSHLVSWHKRIFKIKNIEFYKVEDKFKFYFRKAK